MSFFVCLNLFLHTITDCPSVLLFRDFLCSTSLCCLGLYRSLLYLPLTYLFSELENVRLCVFPCVSCSLFLISQGHKETDVKKRLITTGEYQANRPCVLALLFQNTAVNPGDKASPSSPSHTVHPINSQGIDLFPVCQRLFPSTETGWVLKDVIHYVGFGFTVLLF